MIDFQDERLEPQVFEALYKVSELVTSRALPKFKTRLDDDGKWICEFKIPGIEEVAFTCNKDTEIDAINMCASNLLYILDVIEKKGVYNPDAEDSIYKDEIESYFGSIQFNKEYNYMLSHTSILINDDYFKNYIREQIENNLEKHEQAGEIDKVCDWYDVTYLLKFRKKNYC